VLVTAWNTRLLTTSVTLAADGLEPRRLEVSKWLLFPGELEALATREVGLAQYDGLLLRVDVVGRLRRLATPWVKRPLACSMELTGDTGTTPLEFGGWPRDTGRRMHRGAVGLQARVLEVDASSPPAVAEEGSLWHVLRVPPGASLRLKLFAAPGEGDAPPRAAADPLRSGHSAGRSAARVREHSPDVFIYLIDALRADHLGCYGYDRPTSPAIDAFAAEATFYEHANVVSTWTRPSVASILTGLYPSVHGVMHFNRYGSSTEGDALDYWPVLLPEVLGQAGYRTASIVTNANISEEYGFGRGYDVFTIRNMGTAQWVNSELEDFLAAQDLAQPVFVYLHTIEPHDPYAPSRGALEQFDRGIHGACDGSVEALDEVGHLNPSLTDDDIAHLIDLYDAEIRDADDGFREFLDILRARGRLEDALIILVSDHGESFAEHGTMRHGFNLNREEMQVPLIIRFPEGAHSGVRASRGVTSLDLFPTVLAQVGVDADLPYPIDGVNVSPDALNVWAPRSAPVYAEVSHDGDNGVDLVGVIDEDGYKRVLTVTVPPPGKAAAASLGLWDTSVDFAERDDMADRMSVRAAYCEQLIAHWLAEQFALCDALGHRSPLSVEASGEVEEQLRALGYLR
jgi:arylsulfatase A-like enzyme